MKSCPYCQNPVPEKENTCPACGAVYWNPDQPGLKKEYETNPSREEEEEEECWKWSIILIPSLLAALIFLVLITAGFIIQLLTHFESNQSKIIWRLIMRFTGSSAEYFRYAIIY